MKNKSNLVAYGLMSLALVLGIFLSVKSVNESQDTRSSAAQEEELVLDGEIDGICGSANEQRMDFAPADEDACEIGAINWYDSEGKDGDYNWSCIGTEDGAVADCTAIVGKQ
jgi:hypothetical protein